MTSTKKSFFKDFFLFKRFPWRKDRRVDSPSWQRPEGQAYIDMLKYDKFFTVEELPAHFKAPNVSALADEIEMANEYILPEYYAADKEARFYQSVFLRYQWILIAATFATAVIAAFTIGGASTGTDASASEPPPAATQQADPAASTPLSDAQIAAETSAQNDATLLSSRVLTALGVIAAFFITLYTYQNQRQNPQAKWYKARSLAEAARRHYFLYLAQRPPYDKDDYKDVFYKLANEIRSVGQDVTSNSQTARKAYSAEELAEFFAKYREKREKFQQEYYKNCYEEYDYNAEVVSYLAFALGALGTTIPVFIATTGLQIQYALMIALLPIFITLLTSFEKIYGWKRQSTLYKDAENRLRVSRKYAPYRGQTLTQKHVDEFVDSIELALANETSQWGQLQGAEQEAR